MAVKLTDLTVVMSHSHNALNGVAFHIRIQDQTSGLMIADIDVPNDQVPSLFSTSEAHGSGIVFAADEDDQYGREQSHTRESIPVSVLQEATGKPDLTYWSHELNDKGPQSDAARAWAEGRRQELGATSASTRIAHGKAEAIFHFYGEPTGRA